jgi:hypothetical protein
MPYNMLIYRSKIIPKFFMRVKLILLSPNFPYLRESYNKKLNMAKGLNNKISTNTYSENSE